MYNLNNATNTKNEVFTMGKFLLDMPDEMHDDLRHKSIDLKKDINDLILEAIKEKY